VIGRLKRNVDVRQAQAEFDVMAQTLVLVSAGILVGVAGAIVLARLMAALPYDLAPGDPMTFAVTIVVLLAVAATAGYLPALRASRVDPMSALRTRASPSAILTLMPIAPFYLGLAGDTLTFLGGMILAINAIGKQKEFRKIQSTAAAVSDPLLAKVRFTSEGVSLTNHEDVELVFIRRSVKRAVWGTVVITLGFVCLLLARIYEILRMPSKA
jgi:hypothetical protein